MKELTLKKDTLLIIFGGIILTIILFIPSKIIPTCPKGLEKDTLGGQCGLYSDTNNDQVCDYTQELVPSVEDMTSSTKFQFDFSHISQFILFTILLGLSIFFLVKKQKKYFRYIILIASFIFLGIIAFKSICPISTLQFLILQKDQIVLRIFPFLIFLLPIITTLLIGQIFCGWICPIGAFQEFVYKAVRRMGISFMNFPDLTKKVPRIFDCCRYIVLIIVVILTAVTSKILFCKIDPFGVLFDNPASKIALILFVLTLMTLPFLFRPFCKYICPYGALTGILSSLAIFKIKINKTKCKKCKLCANACLIGAIDSSVKINEQLCNRCGECLRVCKNKAIQLRK